MKANIRMICVTVSDYFKHCIQESLLTFPDTILTTLVKSLARCTCYNDGNILGNLTDETSYQSKTDFE